MDKIVPNLIPGKTYKLRYRSVDANGTESGNSVVYEFTVNDTPAPEQVDQDTISVVTASNSSGIIIRWNPPATNLQKPEAVRYVVEIADTSDFINKTSIDATETSTYFSNEMLLATFGVSLNVIYIRVLSVSATGSSTIPSTYRRYSYIDELELRPPDIVVASGAVNSFLVSWTYVQTTPNIIDGFIVYSRKESESSWTQEFAGLGATDRSYTGVVALGDEGNYYIGVSAFDESENESSIKQSNLITVNAVEDVDTTAPSVPTGLTATTSTDKTAEITWNVSATGSPFGYKLAVSTDQSTWTYYSTPGRSYTIYNLLPFTTYYIKVAAYDSVFNLSSYTSVVSFATPQDIDKPSTPAAIQVLVQNTSQTGNQNIVIKHSNKKANNTDFLEDDIARFDVYVSSTNTNSGGTYIGTIPATSPSTTNNTGYGSTGTITYNFNSSTVGSKYFYTKVVDGAGNASDASATSQASLITYIDNAYIGDITADRIRTGTLAANQAIYVGTDLASQITIKSDTPEFGTPIGKIYSGTGTFMNSNTGFYLDSDGKFSLKDKLVWDSFSSSLYVQGDINAESGEFSGNVHLTDGSLYAGSSVSSGERLVFNKTGISGYNTSGTQTMSLSSGGVFNFTSGRIGSLTAGWEVGTSLDGAYIRSQFNGTSSKAITFLQSATTAKMYIAASGTIPAWKSASTAFYIDNENKFSIGSGLHYDGTTFKVSDLTVTASAMYSGVGQHGVSNTPFFVGLVGGQTSFSLGDKLVWNGSALTINGAVTASSGTIGGWSLATDRLYNSKTSLYSDGRIIAGHFSVDVNGYLTADGANISGTITASAGRIADFQLSPSGKNGGMSLYSGLTDVGGWYYSSYESQSIIYAGRISLTGSVNASSVTATDGYFTNINNVGTIDVNTVTNNGNLSITTTSSGTITLNPGGTARIYTANVWGNSIGTGTNTRVVRIQDTNVLGTADSTIRVKTNVSPTNNYNVFSEKIPKEKISNIDKEYRNLLNIIPTRFEYIRNPGNKVYGFIAEDVYEKIPALAYLDEDGNPEGWNEIEFIPCAIALIQDQQKEIDDLKNRLIQLESKIGA